MEEKDALQSINVVAADNLVTQGARLSAVMILIKFAQDNHMGLLVNTMAVDALALCFPRLSAAMMLNMLYTLPQEIIQITVAVQYWEFIGNTNYVFMFPEIS